MSGAEVWLRGPVEGIDPILQPVAHALLQAGEDVERVMTGVGDELLWRRPNGAASVGFHLVHLIGATDRLFTYARAERLTEGQRAWLAGESTGTSPGLTVGALVTKFLQVVAVCLEQLRATKASTLAVPRTIGRAGLPTTVLGCLSHAGEHASRHVGQLITTVKVVGP